ncbi:MAG: AAA family ATPase [Bacteroidales bacterium]|jgi:predicted ATPase|nr:AAA family ATPase [Bacteroidales bacterium]
MIKEISFKNYKAFEFGKIELKPITLLLGANSVGKSSIVQLLLMLQQTYETKKYKSVLKLNGEFISLGETLNILKDKDKTKTLSLKFKFVSEELYNFIKTDGLKQLSANLIETISYIQRIYNKPLLENELNIALHDKKSNKRDLLRNFTISSKKQLLELVSIIKKAKSELFVKNKFKTSLFDNYVNEIWFFDERISNAIRFVDEIEKTYDLLLSLNTIENEDFSISFELKCIDNKKGTFFKICCISIHNNEKCVLKLEMKPDQRREIYTAFKLNSDYSKLDFINEKITTELEDNINYNSTFFSIVEDCDSKYVYNENIKISSFSKIILKLISIANLEIGYSFEKHNINHVSPLRAHPKRYYFLDKANITTHLDTLDGNSLTEILKENDSLRRKVNNWLSNFGLMLNVDTLQDIIHIIKIKQNNLSLDITDVGFGISQVLPVIVQGFLSFDKSLTIIEQPEIHLHPIMQADLADLFVDIATQKSGKKISPCKYLLIETHSEYLLKRLRRRMSENEKINSDNVAIYYFHPRNEENTGIIERKEINSTGFFDYPKDFYSGELLRDNTEFLKHQIKNK